MIKRGGRLLLEDGFVYHGYFLGETPGAGEVVFNTAMAGYQETLTDPSNCGHLVVMTYPLIGNYGVNDLYGQSAAARARGCVASELCDQPGNWRMAGTVTEFLVKENIPCLYGADTRAITRHIRGHGAMPGVIAPDDVDDGEVRRLLDDIHTDGASMVRQATVKRPEKIAGSGKRVACLDLGVQNTLIQSLRNYDYDITLYPAGTPARELLADGPDGVFLSDGPGDPQALPEIISNIRALTDSGKPLFGVGLGYQLICLALGADTYKLKFGHRGANHPVKDIINNKVVISSQNHGYAVREESLAGSGLSVTHRNINDGTVEGVVHDSRPLFAVQYQPAAPPGARGHEDLFARFDAMMGGAR